MTWIAFLDLHCRMDHSKTEYNYKYNDSSWDSFISTIIMFSNWVHNE
jgi:hypothetical protein